MHTYNVPNQFLLTFLKLLMVAYCGNIAQPPAITTDVLIEFATKVAAKNIQQEAAKKQRMETDC